MTPYTSLLHHHSKSHTWMLHVPGQVNWLDLTDMTALNGPNPLMVIDCLQDKLFPLDGMRAAEQAGHYRSRGRRVVDDEYLRHTFPLPETIGFFPIAFKDFAAPMRGEGRKTSNYFSENRGVASFLGLDY